MPGKYQGDTLRFDPPCPSNLCRMTLSWVGFLMLASGSPFWQKSPESCWTFWRLREETRDGVILKFTHTCVNRYITKSACEWLRSLRERMLLKRKRD